MESERASKVLDAIKELNPHFNAHINKLKRYAGTVAPAVEVLEVAEGQVENIRKLVAVLKHDIDSDKKKVENDAPVKESNIQEVIATFTMDDALRSALAAVKGIEDV